VRCPRCEVETFRSRSLAGEIYPYLWLDATYVKVRDAGRVVSMAALVRSVSPRPASAACSDLSLPRATTRVTPGLRSSPASSSAVSPVCVLVISDAHRGLVRAIDELLLGAAWQRCRVHFTRNAQALVPRTSASMVATVIRSIFEQPSGMSAREQLRRVCEGLAPRFPAVAELLDAATVDLLAHFDFPASHRRQIRSTNPLERLNKEIKRRTAVVGHLPQSSQSHPSGRDGPRRAGRRVAGRPALLQSGVDGSDRRGRHRGRGGDPAQLMAS